jgi:hypothetical protein
MDWNQWNGKAARPVDLAARPEHLEEIFQRLAQAGAPVAALFGGAARDADLGALWDSPRVIKDYDLRCWLDPSFMAEPDWERSFGAALLSAFEGSTLRMAPSAGTGRLRHALDWRGVELDVSARALPKPESTPRDCAVDRALDSDANVSAVAIASDMSAWCEALYEDARHSRELVFYPNDDAGRRGAYAKRMLEKFPESAATFLPTPREGVHGVDADSWRVEVHDAVGSELSRMLFDWGSQKPRKAPLDFSRRSVWESPSSMDPRSAALDWLGGPVRAWEENLKSLREGLLASESDPEGFRGGFHLRGACVEALGHFLQKNPGGRADAFGRCLGAASSMASRTYGFDGSAVSQAAALGWSGRLEALGEGSAAGAFDASLSVDARGAWRARAPQGSKMSEGLSQAAALLNEVAWPFAPWRDHGDGSVEFHPALACSMVAAAALVRAPWTGAWLQKGAMDLSDASKAAGLREAQLAARLWSGAADPFDRKPKALVESSAWGPMWAKGWALGEPNFGRAPEIDPMCAMVATSVSVAMLAGSKQAARERVGRWTLESLWEKDPDRERARRLLEACVKAREAFEGKDSMPDEALGPLDAALAALRAKELAEELDGPKLGVARVAAKPRL